MNLSISASAWRRVAASESLAAEGEKNGAIGLRYRRCSGGSTVIGGLKSSPTDGTCTPCSELNVAQSWPTSRTRS